MSSERKKIVIAAEIYPPDIGGPATYAHELREQLVLHGYTVTLLTFGAGRNKEELYYVSRERNVGIRFFIYFHTLLKLSRSADVIYAMGPGVSGLCAVIVGAMTRKRVVVKVTGDRAWEAAQLQGSEEGIEAFQARRHEGYIGVLERIERWVVQRADTVIVPGIFLKTIVEGWGAKRGKIITIHNALSPLHPASYPMMKEGIQFDERKNLILAIGRLVPWKGIDDAIAALPKVRGEVPDATLTIVGDGPEREHLQAIAQEQGAADHVEFQGGTPRDRLQSNWRCAKVFVLASGYEGFPHLVLEAWAAGVPVVASDIRANRDIIEDGITGMLVPYHNIHAIADALVRVMTDGRLAQRLVEGGMRELGKYQWERVFEETEKVLLS